MPTTTRIQRRYDHRLRDLVQTTGDLELAIGHGGPRSTARGWRAKTTTQAVSLDVVELDTIRLQHEVILLRRRIARLASLPTSHNSAFRGQTPDEMYMGTGSKIPKQLEASRIASRHSRTEANRAQTCRSCEEIVSISS